MEIKISKKDENKMLERTEITAEITFSGATPSNKDVKEAIAKEAGKEANLIIIKNIYTDFGKSVAKAIAYAYDNEKKMKEIEEKKKKVKKDAKEEEKK